MENVLKKRKSINTQIQFENILKNEKEKNNTLINKFIFQIVFCIVILTSIWLYKIADPVNFEYNKNKYGWILEYNMTYDNTYNLVANYLNNNFQFNIPLKINSDLNNIAINNNIQNEEINLNNNNNNENNIELPIINNEENVIENIEGEKEEINNNINNEEENINEINSYNNMQIIAEELKSKYNFVKPTTGQVTCPFGNRESDNKDISTFHLGIDIGNVKGTEIVAAMEGTVTDVSNNSIYGNYIKVTNEDVLIVYAHCDKILVKKGDKVKCGDLIAKMGKTGLATGVHLHFEVRKNGYVINPEYLINFY